MKVLKWIGIILVVLLVLFLIIGAFLPGHFKLETTITIDTPAECPFNHVNDLHHWAYWSPFDDEDPDMVTTYSGPASGLGASSSWVSTKQGNGSMVISKSEPYKTVVTDLNFGERGISHGYFYFDEKDGKTLVTWGMETELAYPVERYVFAMLRGVMRTSFNNGLESLKELCESSVLETPELAIINVTKQKRSDANSDSPHIYVMDLNERWIATILDSCSMADMEDVMGSGYMDLGAFVMKHSQEEYGNPFSIWYKYDEENMYGVFEMGISIKENIPGEGRVEVRKFPATRAVVGIHHGPYDQTRYMYEALAKYVKDHGMEEAGGPIETYIIDPSQTDDPNELVTAIGFPIK